MELRDDHDGHDDHTCHGTQCSLSWEYDLSVSSDERPGGPALAPGHSAADEHRHARKMLNQNLDLYAK